MLIMLGGQREMQREQENQERIRMFGEKENHKQLEILDTATIKQAEMKGKKIRKEYLR